MTAEDRILYNKALNRERVQKYRDAKRDTPEYKEKHKEETYKWRANHKEEYKKLNNFHNEVYRNKQQGKDIVHDILNDVINTSIDTATSKNKIVKNKQKAEYMKQYILKKKLEAKSK